MGDAEHAADRLAIDVTGLHEVFRVYSERPPGLKERLYRLRRARFHEFHALDGVDLQVRHGETIALIGHNGSGKSTLLKCIAGILPADRGTVTVNGRVATLLELGAGFHEELSGRENVFLNGAILGLSRKEIEAAFDDIVDFAGVRDFIDAPVRNYSSGMYVRLGFAIAVHVDPDILLIDEVLSVGDQAFQEKSMAQMRTFSKRGKTVVLVSHDLGAVRALCERTVVLNRGRIVFDGPTDDAIDAYQELITSGVLPEPVEEDDNRSGDFKARITDLRLEIDDAEGRGPLSARGGQEEPVGPITTGSHARFIVEVTPREDLVGQGGLSVGLHVRRPDVHPSVYETRTAWHVIYVAPPPTGQPLTVTYELDLRLLSGSYLVDVLVSNAETGALHDQWSQAAELVMAGPQRETGIAALDADVRVSNPDGVWPPESLPPALEDGGPRYHPLRDGERVEPAQPRRDEEQAESANRSRGAPGA